MRPQHITAENTRWMRNVGAPSGCASMRPQHITAENAACTIRGAVASELQRLNTGGTLLANQEIRNCVYNGKFVEFLKDANRLPDWRAILGRKEPDNRRRDIELLVRFFAMKDMSAYRKPMKEFLSKFMRQNKDAADTALENSRDVFERTCGSVIKTLGDRPFHIRSGLNPAVLDAVMVAFAEHLDEIPNDISERYRNLIESGEFDQDTRRRTTDVERVRARFRQASQRLFGA